MNALLRHQKKILICDYTRKFASTDGPRKFTTAICRSHYGFRRHIAYYPNCMTAISVGVPAPLSLRLDAFLESQLSLHNYHAARHLHNSNRLCEGASSKVEVTVKTMKEKQKEKVEEIIKEAAAPIHPTCASSTAAQKVASEPPKAVVTKKSLRTRIWEEVLHYYHGFRLLFIDINICRKLLWRVLNGKTLTRRENKLLLRTTSDLFRLIPFSVFIIVPFMELLLPVFIKLFPGMLPSTFQTAKEREDKLKQSLLMRLEMAKFLQKTLDEMTVQHKEHKSEDAKQFAEFFRKIKDPNEYVTNEEIIKFAKHFEDEITLDSLSREQLSALCRVLELNTMGTSNFLRFQLNVKLRSLAADDLVISREGVEALDLFELQQACKARGMRAYGLTSDKLRLQLKEWIDLSLNEKVPPTLLLLSRALLIAEDTTTTDKLKESIRVLPDVVATKTKGAIGESEGKIDNKIKIEIIKEEERKIKEEREEEREEEKAKLEEEKAKAEILLDKAPVISPTLASAKVETIASEQMAQEVVAEAPEKKITSQDVELLSSALKSLSKDSKKMMLEKETIKEIKEELEDYKEDVKELHEVRSVVKEPVHESRAAKLLFKKVNSMIGQLDDVLTQLEKKKELKNGPTTTEEKPPEANREDLDLVRIDELMDIIKKLKQTSDESRLKQIENVLEKLDADKDGVITVDEVLKVVEAIGRDNVKLNEKQIEELIVLLQKETHIQAEQRSERDLARSIKVAQQADDAKLSGQVAQISDELKDHAPELKDTATDLSLDDSKNVIKTEMKSDVSPLLNAAEKQKEKIVPKGDISAVMPPTIPPPGAALPQGKPKDKML